nr:MAG TPA: hypothetical protein [Caudoviricetes sp.]
MDSGTGIFRDSKDRARAPFSQRQTHCRSCRSRNMGRGDRREHSRGGGAARRTFRPR